MIKSNPFSFLFLFLLIIGCSSGKSPPVIPENPQSDINLPATELNTDESSHSILGTWTLSINHETLEATVTPNRTLNAHHNVTGMIPDPLVIVNSWDPIEEIADVDIQIHNNTWISVYDVRLIIYTDDSGHELINDDNWTPLWDIPGGQIANPFKAYAKYEPNRIFTGENWHQENFRIKCPGSNYNVQFAVDASHPDNCEEPYEISNFQQGLLNDFIGASTQVSVDVLDWQNDVSEVYLHCPAITNEPASPFEYVSSNRWHLNLINNSGISAGECNAFVYAKSAGSGDILLLDRIIITITAFGIPSDPKIAGRIKLLGQSEYINVCDNLACTFSENILILCDVSNPSDPDIVSSSYLGFSLNNLYVHFRNDLLLVFSGAKYLLLDISDPKNPVKVYEEGYAGFRQGTIRDNILYAEYFLYGIGRVFKIIDITDPFDLVELGSMEVDDQIYHIEVKEDYAYMIVGSWADRLEVIDVSDLNNPESVASLGVEMLSLDFEIFGNYIYLEALTSLYVIDISNPLNAEIIVELDSQRNTDLMVYENHLYALTDYLSDPNYLSVYSLDNPEFPVIIASVGMFDPRDIEFSGNYAYVADGTGGVKIVDIIEPGNPQLIYTLPSINNVNDIAVNNGYAYVATDGSVCGIQIFDISNLSNIDYLSSLDDCNAGNIEVVDDYVYILGWESDCSLYSIDVQDPFSPQIVSQSLASQYPGDLAFEGDIAIAACGYYLETFPSPGAIYRYDISDPTNIRQTGSIISNPLDLRSVSVSSEYAYVTNGDRPLMIIDISDPLTINLAATYNSVYWWHLASQGNYLYNYYSEFSVFDISDPVEPHFIADLESRNGEDILVSGNYAYLAADTFPEGDQLVVVDISDPANPYVFRTLILPEVPERLKKYENYLYVIEGALGRFDPAIDIIQLW